jgi:hypothetical protein
VAGILLFAAILLTHVFAADQLTPSTAHALVAVWGMFQIYSLPWVLALVVVYWVCLFRVPVMSYHRRAMWGLGLFWLSGVVMPLFWYRHLCPTALPTTVNPRGAPLG